jgi:hypothetical protein
MGTGISKGSTAAAEKALLELLPPNHRFKPGDRVKFTTGESPTVDGWRTTEHGTILEGTEDSAFYTIKTSSSDVYYDVPYFFVCPSYEDLYFDDFFRVGTRVMFRRWSNQDFFEMGTVTAVYHKPVAPHSGCLDVRGDDGKTSFQLSSVHYRFPYSFYTDIIGRHQRRGKYTRPSRADLFRDAVEEGVVYVANELIGKMTRTSDDGVYFYSGWHYSKWAGVLGRDLGVPDCVLDTLNDDKFVEKVTAHMGSNFQWHKQVYGDGSFAYTIKMRPSEKLLKEIRDRGFFPTESPGVGGAMYREARESFTNR